MSFFSSAAPLSFPALLLNLALGCGCSVILAGYYAWFGASLSNRAKFAPILPLVTLIILLLLTVVKFSPALSLGLFSAMSIVRYRTAIKDPEELVFLFLAVGIGLGLGTGQVALTLAGYAVILVSLLVYAFSRRRYRSATHKLYLSTQMGSGDTAPTFTAQVSQLLAEKFGVTQIVQQQNQDRSVQITCSLRVRDEKDLAQFMDRLRGIYPTCRICIVEQTHPLGG